MPVVSKARLSMPSTFIVRAVSDCSNIISEILALGHVISEYGPYFIVLV